jgi:hypothetical protein
MEYPIADIIDRLSIVWLKVKRIGGGQFDEECRQLESAKAEYESINHVNFEKEFLLLYETNGNIWDLEADIRQGKEGKLGLEEVGRRALLIRGFNNFRVKVKNEIARRSGGFEEVKKDHASE